MHFHEFENVVKTIWISNNFYSSVDLPFTLNTCKQILTATKGIMGKIPGKIIGPRWLKKPHCAPKQNWWAGYGFWDYWGPIINPVPNKKQSIFVTPNLKILVIVFA